MPSGLDRPADDRQVYGINRPLILDIISQEGVGPVDTTVSESITLLGLDE